MIRKDYYNICELLGDYQGKEHHDCAYDLDCQDCVADAEREGCDDFRAAMLACIRECFVASKGDNKSPQAKGSYVCASHRGEAALGSRLVRLTEAFAEDGLFLNICDPEGFGPVMQELGAFVADRLE